MSEIESQKEPLVLNASQSEIARKRKELEKGCGKEFIYLAYYNEKRICGTFEDLKHSENIILCPKCRLRLFDFEKDIKMAKKECLENDIRWLRTILKMDKNNFKGMLEAQLKLLEKELKKSLEENKK